MGVDPEQVEAPVPVPAGWYDLKIKEINVSKTSKGSYSYNVITTVENTNNPDWDGKKRVKIPLYTTAGWNWPNVYHGAGFESEDVFGDAQWEFDKEAPDDPTKAQYKGPLLGKVIKAEVIVRSYQGNESNAVKQITCKVKDCKTRFPKIKHSTDMIGKQK